ncbi:MAG: hypothetical protein IPL27_01120 [Lewinellaceae bacterium]|nr:hypothetical protein [Lewinellaceae bacterium]
MTNKGINPLYVSALDVLIGTLGVFIVLNFLQSRLVNATPAAVQAPIAATAKKTETTPQPSKPANGNNGSWWRRTFGAAEKPATASQPSSPNTPAPKPGRNQPAAAFTAAGSGGC